LRQQIHAKNLLTRPVVVRSADILPYRFAAPDPELRLLRVTQWTIIPRESNFGVLQTALPPDGTPLYLRTGSRGSHCTWMAVAGQQGRGLFAGWEFDGRADAYASHSAAESWIQLSAAPLALYQLVEPGEEFAVPAGFLGVYSGDWDEAGYRTQRFVEAALAAPAPSDGKFPYAIWDSWGYGRDVDEQTLRHNAELASQLGIEVFVVDLGWAQAIGHWRADPEKFPSGLRDLSDYVHSLGMKFGLHFAFAEAEPGTPVLDENPDWTSSETYYYHGALSLCLAHRPVQDWAVEQAVNLIDDYRVDWILQDGENMVKLCTKTTHSHDARNSNYAGAAGLDEVLQRIRAARPAVLWENCEDGGNMMTFKMVGNYVTSITNDASGAFESREAVYGATYPFPPRYADRYMIEETLTPYVTRSHIFGGPWIFMNRLPEVEPEQFDLARSEIALFKSIRGLISEGQVFHIARPMQDRIDALQSYNPELDRAVAVVTREGGAAARYRLRIRGLVPERTYRVTFATDPAVFSTTGEQLATTGVPVLLDELLSSEVVFADPL